jgi:transcription antitermination factor NusG
MSSTLNLYWTPPQREDKAAREIRQIGHRAYVPKERDSRQRLVPTARSYIAATGKPSEAKYVGRCIGPVTRDEIRRLYVRTSKTQRKHAYSPGDQVSVKRGRYADLAATVVEAIRSGWYLVRVSMFGRTHEIKVKESDLARLHPGIK